MNTSPAKDKISRFLESVEESLNLGGCQSRSILDEIESDLESHVAAHREAGKSEDEAVDLALEEMGNPYELSHQVKKVVPPRASGALFWGRIVIAILVGILGFYVAWSMRAWSYGFSPASSVAFVLLYFPAILLLWPTIVWRWNWVFGLIPVGCALGALGVVMTFGVSQTTEVSELIEIFESGDAALQPELVFKETLPEPASLPPRLDEPEISWVAYPVLGILIALTASLILMMQQNSQRRKIVALVVISVAVIEIPFQLEEARFRREITEIDAVVVHYGKEQGKHPDEEWLLKEGPQSIQDRRARYALSRTGDSYSVFWNRPLSSGFALSFSSEDGRMWIND